MYKQIKILACSVLSLSFVACSTTTDRNPAQSAGGQIVRYVEHYTCMDNTNNSENKVSYKWSALSGLKIGFNNLDVWRKSNKKVLRPFSSDGCSSSPDGFLGASEDHKWTECCIEHDIAYWIGGTLEQKERADEDLQQCISDKGFPEVGKIYKMFVKKFGGPMSSQSFRWGYGWNYKRPFSALSNEERGLIEEEYQKTVQNIHQKVRDVEALSLYRMCDTYDFGLQPLTSEEEKIFELLNNKLKREDTIEWAKVSYFNLESTDYLFKLKSCDIPGKVTIFKDKSRQPHLSLGCQ